MLNSFKILEQQRSIFVMQLRHEGWNAFLERTKIRRCNFQTKSDTTQTYKTKQVQKRENFKKLGLLKLSYVSIKFRSGQTCQAKHLNFKLATNKTDEAETKPTTFEQTPVEPKKN